MAQKIKSRLGSLGGKIAVKFKRPWRGYPVGTIIHPPATMRQMLVSSDVADAIDEEIEKLNEEGVIPRKRGRPTKSID